MKIYNMIQLINETMQSESVQQLNKRLHLQGDAAWDMYYNTGIGYLEDLQRRCHKKRVFDQLFKRVRHIAGHITVPQLFSMIERSPYYWLWWGTHYWCTSRELGIETNTELYNRLRYTALVIPYFVMIKIINNEQERQEVARIETRAPVKKAKVASRKRTAGDRVV